MADTLQKRLERWISAGVVDASTASRIRTFEESQGSGERLRWPVLLHWAAYCCARGSCCSWPRIGTSFRPRGVSRWSLFSWEYFLLRRP